jgi:hypothetical protein
MPNQQPDLRHNFAVLAMGRARGWFQPRRYLYRCIRCKWSFVVVAGWQCVITPLPDDDKTPLFSNEVVRRLESFAKGPCPAICSGHSPTVAGHGLPTAEKRADFIAANIASPNDLRPRLVKPK